MRFAHALAAREVAALGPVAARQGVHASLWLTDHGGAMALLRAFRLPAASALADKPRA